MYHFNFSCNVTAGRAHRRAARLADPNAGNFHRGPHFLAQLEASAMADSTASFEADAIGAAPKGWTATKTGKGDSKWTIEQDKTAPSKVVKQSGRATYPLLLKEDSNIKDGFIQIKFKAVAGAEDRAGGVVWRARDANNYYVARAKRSRTTSCSTRPSKACAAHLTS